MAMSGWVWIPVQKEKRLPLPRRLTQSGNRDDDDDGIGNRMSCYSSYNYDHLRFAVRNRRFRVYCSPDNPIPRRKDSLSQSKSQSQSQSQSTGIQVYREVERLVTDIVKQSQDSWAGGASNWSEVEGSWVLGPRHSKPWSIVHFIGGIFVGAAPQLAYRIFLERLSEKGILVIATPYASGFDHFFIADEVQFKFDRCCRALQETVEELPTFGIGHSLGSVVHLLIDYCGCQGQGMLFNEMGVY